MFAIPPKIERQTINACTSLNFIIKIRVARKLWNNYRPVVNDFDVKSKQREFKRYQFNLEDILLGEI